VTARREGADQPHYHLVDPAALDLATGAAMAHITGCAVCTLAYHAVQRRGDELGALGDVESTPATGRDRLYGETGCTPRPATSIAPRACP